MFLSTIKLLTKAEDIFNSEDISTLSFKSEVETYFEVTIDGEVVSPGRYRVTSKTTLNDLYTMAGGFKDSADQNAIFFSRESIRNKERNALDGASRFLVDALISQSAALGNTSVALDIESIVQLSASALPAGRITGDFSEESNMLREIFLEDEDLIYVPTFSNTISIMGEVLNPVSVLFDEDKTFLDYLNLAGGYSDNADKSNVFVIKANGESYPLNQSLFKRQLYPAPGDTIVVTRDVGVKGLPLISIATKIISDIAFSAASLNAIQN